MNLSALLAEQGRDPRPIFAGAGFDIAQFEDPDTEVSFLAASGLLAQAVSATDCEHLGLLLGQRTQVSSLGVTGFMLQCAPDVGTALQDLMRYLDLHDRGGKATVSTSAEHTHVGYFVWLPGARAVDQIQDLAIAVVCKIMRQLCGDSWKPTEVLLSRRAPREPAPYRQFFRAPVRFDVASSSLVFPTQWLGYLIASADPLLHQHLEQVAARLHAARSRGLVGELRGLVHRALVAQKCRADLIAEQLGLHERTLRRRLRQEGTTFREQLECVRYEVARRLLAETDMPLSQIGATLDYADATAFIRAFKRWSSLPPSEWRRAHGAAIDINERQD